MSRYDKLYNKMKNNPKNVKFEDIDKLLTKIGGFSRSNPRGGSSHYTYSHPNLVDILTIPKDRPVKAIYIKRALKYFDLVNK